MGGRSPLPLLFAAGLGVLSGLYIWKEPLQEYTEAQKNAGKPLVPPSDVSPKATPEQAAVVTAPRKDAPEAAAAAAAAPASPAAPAGETPVPHRRN